MKNILPIGIAFLKKPQASFVIGIYQRIHFLGEGNRIE
jgi:hypothetical protein